MEWMILPLKRYADFRGRSRRKEFWLWVLFLLIVTVVLSVIETMLGLGSGSFTRTASPTGAYVGAGTRGGVLTGLFTLAVLVPNVAVQVRRLHDIDRTGWWVLGPVAAYGLGALLMLAAIAGSPGLAVAGGILMFAGFILAIVLLVFACLPGTAGMNRFGPDPKDPSGARSLQDVFG